jgi:hypothetical protein
MRLGAARARMNDVPSHKRGGPKVAFAVMLIVLTAVIILFHFNASQPQPAVVAATFLRYEHGAFVGDTAVIELTNTTPSELNYFLDEGTRFGPWLGVLRGNQSLQLRPKIVPGATNIVVVSWKDEEGVMNFIKDMFEKFGYGTAIKYTHVWVALPALAKLPNR